MFYHGTVLLAPLAARPEIDLQISTGAISPAFTSEKTYLWLYTSNDSFLSCLQWCCSGIDEHFSMEENQHGLRCHLDTTHDNCRWLCEQSWRKNWAWACVPERCHHHISYLSSSEPPTKKSKSNICLCNSIWSPWTTVWIISLLVWLCVAISWP